MKGKIAVAVILLTAVGLFVFEGADFLRARLSPNGETFILSEDRAEEDDSPASFDVKEAGESHSKESEEKCITKINELEEETLMKISGVGEVTAEKIINYGEVRRRSDLEEIHGIGEIMSERIEKFVCEDLKDLEVTESKKEKDGPEIEQVSDGVDDSEGAESVEDTVSDEKREKEVRGEDIKKLKNLLEKQKEKIAETDESSADEKDEKKEEEKKTEEEEMIDINSAEAEKLEKITGIGPVYAERIVENRPFCNMDELTEVSGIGPVTLENIKKEGLAKVKDGCEGSVKGEKTSSSKEELDKYEKRVESLEEEVSLLEDDYFQVRGMLRETERELSDLEEKHNEELISVKRQRDECRFDQQININDASKQDLESVDRIGSEISQNIKDFLEDSPIEYLEELKEVENVGKVRIKKLIEEGFCVEKPEEENGDDDEDDEEDEDEDEDEDGDESDESRVEVNAAQKEELEELIGIGPAYAERIIDQRPFCKLSELEEVSGIGSDTLEDIKNQDIAYVDPPLEDCFERNLSILNLPESIYSDQTLNPVIEMEDFKEGTYELIIKIEEDGKKTRGVSWEEADDEKQVELELEAINQGDVDFVAKIIKGEEVVVTESKVITIEERQTFSVTFKEENDLEDVGIKIYEEESLENQIGEQIETGSDGKAEKELRKGTYWFEAILEGYESYEDSFDLSEDKTVEFELETIENMLKNPYFGKGWRDDSPKNWSWGNRGELKLKENPLLDGVKSFSHEPYSNYRDLKQSGILLEEGTHHVEVRYKGTGGVKLGVIYSTEEGEHEEWLSQNYEYFENSDWSKISFQPEIPEDTEGRIKIRLIRKEETGEELTLGAAWFSTDEPPENWPK